MKKILNFIILFFALFLNRFDYFLKREFDSPPYEQIFFHLDFAGEKIDFDINILYLFLKKCILLPAILVLIIYFISRLFENKIKDKYILLLNISLLFIAIIMLLDRVSFFDSFKHQYYIDENYIYTDKVKAPIQKENLILIYVESLENSYREKHLFNKNLLENLDNQTQSWLSFPHYRQNYGGSFTMGAIVSTQCGIPLRPKSWYNKKLKKDKAVDGNELGEISLEFLPNAVCLGDILKKDGYTNLFLGGADSKFAGKDKFFKQHGYDLVMGRQEWEARGETEMNGWGLYDDLLFKNAKLELDKVYATGKPFNLTVLTVDTHHPYGFINPTCKKRGVENFTGIVECSADLVVDFLKYIEAKGYMKNTNVIVMGDHLAMSNTEIQKLKSLPQRTIYNKIYSPEPIALNRDTIFEVSMMPTILELLNYELPNHRVGLGASGISPQVPQEYRVETEPDGGAYLEVLLKSKSDLIGHFWGEQ